jgi:ABC-type phosphate transport system permease subunit
MKLKNNFKKILIFAIPKLIILILAFIGLMHIWYSINFCEINFIDSYLSNDWNRTIYANYNELPYFFNTSHGKIQMPANTNINCSLAINPIRIKQN